MIMIKTGLGSFASMCVITIAVIIFVLPSIAEADTWRGTAPFCAGKCLLPGEIKIGENSSGDGGRVGPAPKFYAEIQRPREGTVHICARIYAKNTEF